MEVVSRALWWTATRGATLAPPTPEANEDGGKGKQRVQRQRERDNQTGTEYIPTRLDNSNADLGTERMEPVPRTIAEQRERERERRKSAREVRRAEGRRSRDHRLPERESRKWKRKLAESKDGWLAVCIQRQREATF